MSRPAEHPAGSAAPAPEDIAAAFGPAAPALVAYAELLAGPGVERGLLGPAEPPRLWERHLANCAAVTALLPQGARVADLGSGAGLPGIVLALCRPDLRLVLVEPMARRWAFLLECVDELGLAGRVEVRRTRAEDCGPLAVPVVVARALATLGRLVELAAPLLTPGGALLAIKGRRASAEVTGAAPVLARHRLDADVRRLPAPGGGETTVIVASTAISRWAPAETGRCFT